MSTPKHPDPKKPKEGGPAPAANFSVGGLKNPTQGQGAHQETHEEGEGGSMNEGVDEKGR